jgi:hypothetical protein
MTYRVLIPVLAALALGCARSSYIELYPFGASVSYQLEQREALESRVKTVPVQRNDRVAQLVEMFEQAGCTGRALRLENVTGSPTPNVICTLPGKSSRRIIVSTHHVLARGGKGVFDAWTSVALLPTLYASLKSLPRHHTYEFIGFASTPFKGDASYHYLSDDPIRQERTAAMIWLDYLGLGEISAWGSRSDPNLFVDLVSAARALKIQLVSRDLSGAAMIHDHSRAFRWFDIPTLYVHSLSLETERVIGTKRFDMDPKTIDLDAYFDSYRVLATYLGYLDVTLDARKL